MIKFQTLILRQKRLIIIFLLTIVLPSIILSIFGIMAIRNEKYRRDQQVLDEQQKAMMLLKSQFSAQLKSVEILLRNTAQLPAFSNREYRVIQQNLNVSLRGNAPVDQVFILFEDGYSFYPFLESGPAISNGSDPVFTDPQQGLIEQAWQAEFSDNDYRSAISLYDELLNQTTEYNTRAVILNRLARAQKKSGKIVSAIRTYERIVEVYPSSLTSTRLPLAITAEIQMIDCERILGRASQALDRTISLYESIVGGEWTLNKDQYMMYAEMAEQIGQDLFNESSVDTGNREQYNRFGAQRELYQERVGQWEIRRKIEAEIIPVLKNMTSRSESEPFHLSREIQGDDFLITVVPLSGLLCVKWDNDRLIREWLKPIAENLSINERFNVTITDISGQVLLEDGDAESEFSSVTGEFDDYFPPWKIQIARASLDDQLGTQLYQSYYFWSILIMLIVLIFGTLLIVRSLAHEREVMAMKSEFISSVSHELKTPLTSIRALTERLLEGKVKSKEKMQQYFLVIDQDASRLTRLVKNILDFSKIEAGKKEYHFEITDITIWLDEAVGDFCKDHIHDHIEINKHFEPDIPSVAIDRDALSQCIFNLLDNAIKFSPDSKSVDLDLKKEYGSVLIRVKDRGIGIQKDNLDHIFDKFFQATSPVQQSVKGTGLGLALVKHVIEAHKGRIQLESSPGQGSVFTLFLPIVNSN